MVRDAVLKGVGAPCLPISLVNHDLAAARLAQWGEADGPEIAVWALYPSRHLLSARDSAFLDPLKGAFPNGTPDELAGCIVRVERHAGRPRCVTVDAIDERLQRRWPRPPSWIVEKRPEKRGHHGSITGSSRPRSIYRRSQFSNRSMFPVPAMAMFTVKSMPLPTCTRRGPDEPSLTVSPSRSNVHQIIAPLAKGALSHSHAKDRALLAATGCFT